jgi:hypothetical protein
MKSPSVFVRNRNRIVGILLSLPPAMLPLFRAQAQAQNVLTEHNDNARTGANTNETILTTANVASANFVKLFADSVDGQVYAQPLYVQNLNISGGTHNVVFVCTENNSVYAFDADTGGATYWHDGLGTPFSSSCSDLQPMVGITGTPLIDLSSGTLYVDTKLSSGPTHKLHALDITTGNEKFGGPVTVSASSFSASVEHQRPGLLLLNGVVYVAFGSHCDGGSYHGFLIGYNASTLAQTAVFNASASGSQGAIWQSGGGPAVDASGNIYVMTGNGSFDGGANFGESFVKLNGGLSVLDFATPSNWSTLNANDTDFGAGGPVCLPSGFVVGEGKDGNMYVANESNMGHVGHFAQAFGAASGADTVGPVVYWNGPSKQYVFATHGNSPTKSFQWNGTSFNTTPLGTASFSQNDRVGGASLSANGTGNGILWEIGSDNNLRAYDAVNFPTVLKTVSVGTYVKMNRPTIANGKVYVGTASNLGVWGLNTPPGPDYSISASPGSQTVTPGNGASYTVTVTALNGFSGTVSLSASGLPSAASASFNPTSITGSGTSTMSVTTSGSTPTGTSTLTITGAFGTTNHTTTVQLVVSSPSSGAQPISINFVGGGSDNTLSSGQSAGVVSQANWNNAAGPAGSGQSLNDNNGAVTTATLSWSADHTTTESLTATDGNTVMMNGSINTTSNTTTTVTVSGLTNNANGWTVYVYCEEKTGATRVGAYKISGTGITTTTINATDPGLFNGTFTRANNSTGNYVVFTNIVGNVSGFTVSATPVSSTDQYLRSPINGIQIIPATGGSPPQPPTGLTATAGNAQVGLNWNSSAGATSYNVKRSTTTGGEATITNVTTTSFNDTGLNNGTTYFYVVSALNSNGESGNSSEVSATPAASPASPPISIDFVGSGTSMGGSEVAGVVPTNNWNNATTKAGSNLALVDATGASTTATVTWSADHTSSNGTNNTPGNFRMIQGLINTATNTTTTVTVNSLPADSNGYKIYVYCTENTFGTTRVAAYKISGSGVTTTTINATDPGSFSGTFTQANNSTGNYVVFTIGNVSAFTVSATPVSASDGILRAPFNGMQIVPQ